jgi:hypothetical protein
MCCLYHLFSTSHMLLLHMYVYFLAFIPVGHTIFSSIQSCLNIVTVQSNIVYECLSSHQ